MSIEVNTNPPSGLRDGPISCRYCFIPLLFSSIPMRWPSIARVSYSFSELEAACPLIIRIASGRISWTGTENPFTCRNIVVKAFLPITVPKPLAPRASNLPLYSARRISRHSGRNKFSLMISVFSITPILLYALRKIQVWEFPVEIVKPQL